MMRSLRPAALLVLAGAALALAGCGAGTDATVDDAEPIGFEQLSRAAQASADATSGRFSFSFELSMPGSAEAFAFAGDGAFDARAERSAFSLDLSSFATMLGGLFAGLGGAGTADAPDFDNPEGWNIDAVQDGDVMYLRFPAVASTLPAGASWVRMDLGGSAAAHGFDFSQLQGFTENDPRQALDFLRAVSDEIETVGREELRGAQTTHYRGTLDLREYAKLAPDSERQKLGSILDGVLEESGLAELPVDVWLDDSGLVRRLDISFSATQPGTTQTAAGSMTYELYDYGEDVKIELPSADEVVDADAVG